MNLILIGFMGVGKTSVGKGLAKRLGWPFIDTDALIERARSMTISEIFATCGEACFRKLEKAVIEDVARREGWVVATGGGAVLDPENVDRLRKSGFLIHLTVSPETLFHRIGHLPERPLLRTDNPRQTLEILFRSREDLYHACSHLTIDRNGLGLNETIQRVLEALAIRGIIPRPQNQAIERG
jgi:shikimate kinase